MKKVIQEKLYFAFRDADGVPAFTIKTYDGEPVNPRFLVNADNHVFLLRRPEQVIMLDNLGAEFYPVLTHASKVRFVETPEDSSEIVRQYDIPVTLCETASPVGKMIVPADDGVSMQQTA